MLILYLEDNQPDANLVSRYVNTTPHKLMVVTNTAEALRALEYQPDLILVDVVLNHSRDGLNFIRDIREAGYNQPIIAVTGLSTPRDLDECRRSGVDSILNKPFAITDLAAVIHSYV